MKVVAAREVLMDGLRGTEQLVEKITTIIRNEAKRPEVRELARRVVSLARPQDATAEIQAVWDYLTGLSAPPYRMDPADVQLLTTPAAFPALSGTDCKKYTIAAGGILEALGHQVKVRVVDQRPQQPSAEPGYHHVYLQVFNKDTGRWVAFDPVTRSFRRPSANVGTELGHQARRTYMIRPATQFRDGRVIVQQPMGNWFYENVLKHVDPTRPENKALRTAAAFIPGASQLVAVADAAAVVNKAVTGAGAKPAAPPPGEKAVTQTQALVVKGPTKSPLKLKVDAKTKAETQLPRAGTKDKEAEKEKEGLSTGAKVGIAAGVVGAIGLAIFAATRKKTRRANPRRRRKRRAA